MQDTSRQTTMSCRRVGRVTIAGGWGIRPPVNVFNPPSCACLFVLGVIGCTLFHFISLDVTAAFDTVDHELLLHRLQRQFGLRGVVLEWLRSYLSGRTFGVVFRAVLEMGIEPNPNRTNRTRTLFFERTEQN